MFHLILLFCVDAALPGVAVPALGCSFGKRRLLPSAARSSPWWEPISGTLLIQHLLEFKRVSGTSKPVSVSRGGERSERKLMCVSPRVMICSELLWVNSVDFLSADLYGGIRITTSNWVRRHKTSVTCGLLNCDEHQNAAENHSTRSIWNLLQGNEVPYHRSPNGSDRRKFHWSI